LRQGGAVGRGRFGGKIERAWLTTARQAEQGECANDSKGGMA